MIGKVIEGRYTGASVYKHPEKNNFYIETEDGTKIALSKENVFSIDDVTKQYSTNKYSKENRKTIMVIWKDIETSVIQFGSVPPTQLSGTRNVEKIENSNKISNKPNKAGINIGFCGWIVIVILLCLIGSCSSNSGDSYPRGYEECFRCDGAGLVNEGFVDFEKCPVCRGSGMIDSHK